MEYKSLTFKTIDHVRAFVALHLLADLEEFSFFLGWGDMGPTAFKEAFGQDTFLFEEERAWVEMLCQTDLDEKTEKYKGAEYMDNLAGFCFAFYLLNDLELKEKEEYIHQVAEKTVDRLLKEIFEWFKS